MSQLGGWPDDPREHRLRPEPRPVRPAAAPPTAPIPEPEPPPPAPLPEISGPVVRPDRSRMDPASLSKSAEREIKQVARQQVLTSSRMQRARRIDQSLKYGAAAMVLLGMGGGLYWFSQRGKAVKYSPALAQPPPAVVMTATPGSGALEMLRAFLAAPDAKAKAAFVCESERVRPQMEKSYAASILPEKGLQLGVPQPLEPGILTIPATVAGPPDFVLHLIVREEPSGWKLDWETYEQEMSQRFVGFASVPGKKGGEFRLVVERAHDFDSASEASVFLRVGAPGAPALAEPVFVPPALAGAVKEALPWSSRRRALLRLEWTQGPSARPQLILQEVRRWEFLPP